MLVANSFDLWQKDAFFSAAEEVQRSADRMESAFREWVRERRVTSQDLDELSRDLQTALGTAKWQLEEFEKAVRLSYRNRTDDITTTRHREFVAAIENQISQVEAALTKSFSEEHKKPLRWVTLEQDEHDDFAAFLSGAPGTSKSMKDEHTKQGSAGIDFTVNKLPKKTNIDHDFDFTSSRHSYDQAGVVTDEIKMDIDANHVLKRGDEITETRDDIRYQADRPIGARKTWSPPDISVLKIVIDDGDGQNNSSTIKTEATPKEKGFKPSFWMARSTDHLQAKARISGYVNPRGINWINQLFGKVYRNQRQLQAQQHMQLNCSFPLKFVLMLMIILIVPFLLYVA